MPYPIEKKLVVAVSSSAIFDMTRAHKVFMDTGEAAYRKYQRDRVNKPFQKGVAFPFIRRLLNLNRLYQKEEPVEVVVLSKNDPETGCRFFRSCEHYSLPITRGAFLTGKSPHAHIVSFNASLFLSADESDVVSAMSEGLPAGLVLPSEVRDDDNDLELRVAFDFDGVIADDQAERVYDRSQNLELFHKSEIDQISLPHNPGPLKDLITKMAFFQKLEHKKASQDPTYKPALRIAIITARNAPANERLVTTLKHWGISADETFFLGGIEKKRVLDVLRPHIYFDDQIAHLQPAAKTVPSVHIPFGIKNRRATAVGSTSVEPKLKRAKRRPFPGSAAIQEELRMAIPIPGTNGLVMSPYAPSRGYVDVRGYPEGTHALCPYTRKTFVVP